MKRNTTHWLFLFIGITFVLLVNMTAEQSRYFLDGSIMSMVFYGASAIISISLGCIGAYFVWRAFRAGLVRNMDFAALGVVAFLLGVSNPMQMLPELMALVLYLKVIGWTLGYFLGILSFGIIVFEFKLVGEIMKGEAMAESKSVITRAVGTDGATG